MEKLPEHKILKFYSDTLQYVRKEIGLDKPGQMDAAIDLLDNWVQKQPHFTKKNFSREYLERAIIFDKGSVERAKVHMDKLCTMKTMAPNFFDKINPKDGYAELFDCFSHGLLPKLTKEHYRIYAAKVYNDDYTSLALSLGYSFGTLILEHIRSYDYCTGFIGIIDYRSINLMHLISQVNIIELHQMMNIMTEGYQMRVKAIHILTTSKAIDIVVRILRQVFSKKIGERIRVHMTLDSLYECVPKNLLPKEFGGELKSLVDIKNDWVDVLGTKENMELMKEMNKATVIEDLRYKDNMKMNDDILGISGSFKTLCVD